MAKDEVTQPCEFDRVCTRNVPHILENIFFSLDYKSFKACKEVCKTWNELMASDVYQKKLLGKKDIYVKLSSQLCEAAMYGRGEEVEKLLQAGADPNEAIKYGSTPLHLVVYNNKKDVVKQLLNAGADPNKADTGGGTALHRAVQNHYISVIKELLDGGADPNRADTNGRTPLHWAVKNHYISVIKELLDGGADPNKADCMGMTPLTCALAWALHRAALIEVVEVLIKGGAMPNYQDKAGMETLGIFM